MSIVIRNATPVDAGLIVRFITELAIYEKLSEAVIATEADIRRDLFGPTPRVFCEIAEWDGAPAGFALWFYSYSTFLGQHGIFLEDLFVFPTLRGKGIGKALLKHLARRCLSEGLGRFEWNVLDWNTPAIDFYKAQGAVIMGDWKGCRVSGDALARLGGA